MRMRLACCLLAVMMFASCSRDAIHRYVRETTAMDTYLSITTYDSDLSRDRADALIDSAFTEIRRVEEVMTDYADTSEVGAVNLHAGKETVEVSEELAQLLRTSLAYSAESDGAFDVSVGALVKAWNFLASGPELPSRSKIRMLLRLTGYRKITLEGRRVFLAQRGMRIDLGAIAKGYAVDRAVAVLKRNGVQHAIVDLGGNLGVSWHGTHGLDTNVAEILIRHPRKDGKFFGAMKVGTCGISTSGDYQRYFFKEGVRYHHILNPATGYPARDVVSVTIVADDATTADGFSTLVFVLGREKGMAFIKKHPGVEGVIVWEDGGRLNYEVSPGLDGKFIRSDD